MTNRGSPGRLILLSFLMLFVELGLIRWTGSYVVYLSFFTNFVLLASFLGVGVGFLRAGARRSLFRLAPLAFAGLVVFLAVFPVQGGRVNGELPLVGGFGWSALPTWISLTVIFVLSFATLAATAEGVARTFVVVRAARGVPVGHPGQHPGDRRVLRSVPPPSVLHRRGA